MTTRQKRLGIFLLLSSFIWIGCQTTPPETRVKSSSKRTYSKKKLEPLFDWSKTPIEVKENTVLIDARSQFEYSLSHIDGAVHLRWEDFDLSLNEKNRKAKKRKLNKVARRLALKGVNPESHVIVYGKGSTGKGEEGRIAWMLYYLGVQNVAFVGEQFLKSWPWSNEKQDKSKNSKYWEPKLVKRIALQSHEFDKLLKKNGEYRENSRSMEENSAFRVIDVRTEKEYLGKTGLGLMVSTPDFGAMNVSWKEFFSRDGRLNTSVKSALRSVGIKKDTKIIVISERGVRSSAVTMALIAMGFPDVSHLEGGIRKYLNMDD